VFAYAVFNTHTQKLHEDGVAAEYIRRSPRVGGGGRYAQDFMPELNASQLRLPKRVASATHSAAMYVAKLSFSLWREHQQKKDVDKYT
jgi:hypothetical protein